MKIYPSIHKIIQTQEVNMDIDIPLAYINAKFTDYKTNIVPAEAFISSAKREIVPYSSFDNLDVSLFNENGEKVDNTHILQRLEDKYQYVPQDAISFYPQRFNYSVVGKKKITYSTNKQYDIKAACIDKDSLMTLSKNLISVFGDAPRRKICPSNISINSMDISAHSLTNSSIEENDIVFIETNNGKTYVDGAAINFNDFLDKHTNVWLSVTSHEDYPINIASVDEGYTLKSNNIVKESSYKTKYAFNLPEVTPEEISYVNIFNETKTPILIIEHPKKGFIIISHKSFLDNVKNNINLLYEVMMYVYTNSYIETEAINEWIADKVPDYIVLNNGLTQKDKFTSSMELPKMFGLNESEILFADIKIDELNIKFSGMTNNYIIFKKEYTGEKYEQYADPAKPEGKLSIFTPRQNILYYEKFLYVINDALLNVNNPEQNKINVTIANDKLNIIVKPLKHSLDGINIIEDTVLEYSLYRTFDYKEIKVQQADVYICCKDNILKAIDKSEYKLLDGIILATIELRQSKEQTNVFDMRQRGGGLPEGNNDNYDLLDIGHILGRPYRKSSTLIFKLPIKLQPYEDIILKAIKKHMVAEELPIIIFEEKE
jgi:hypothetical protein